MDKARKLVLKEVIEKVIKGEDYRIVTQTEINAQFLTYCIGFFKRVVETKISGGVITKKWYKTNFVMNESFKPQERAIYAGINDKTIKNMFNSGTKEIVISASEENYDRLVNAISKLIDGSTDLDLTLSIKFKGVSVELNLDESLIIITSLAVKRAAITGGAYSKIGKNVEGPLMLTLCNLFGVAPENYSLQVEGGGLSTSGDFSREIDFFLKNNNNTYKCEVKLMGNGNPEVADAVIARESDIFVADKLSETNIKQLDSLNVHWTYLRSEKGYLRFGETLKAFNIPHSTPNDEHLDELLSVILNDVLK
jgi:hypothetical protein